MHMRIQRDLSALQTHPMHVFLNNDVLSHIQEQVWSYFQGL